MKDYPNELNIEEWDDFLDAHWTGPGSYALMYFDEDEEQNLGTGSIVIEDKTKRWQAMKLYAEETNGQIYTEVDLDSGEIGYEKGPRMVNSLGLYAVLKIPGFKVDNS